MIRIRTALLAAGACLVGVGGAEAPPRVFFDEHGLAARAVWSSYSRDGAFDVQLYIADYCDRLARGNRDQPWTLARQLATIEVDPFPALRLMLGSEEPVERAFAAAVCGMLGEPRSRPLIKKLVRDREHTEWALLRTVSEAAEFSIQLLDEHGHPDIQTLECAEWLVRAKQEAEQGGVPDAPPAPSSAPSEGTGAD